MDALSRELTVMKKDDVRATAVARAKLAISAEGFRVQPLLLADRMLAALGPLLTGAPHVRPRSNLNKLPGLNTRSSAAAKTLSPLNAVERCEPH